MSEGIGILDRAEGNIRNLFNLLGQLVSESSKESSTAIQALYQNIGSETDLIIQSQEDLLEWLSRGML